MYAIIPLLGGHDKTRFNAANVVFSARYGKVVTDMIRKFGCEVVVSAHYECSSCVVTPTCNRLLCVKSTDGAVNLIYQKICPNTGIAYGDRLLGAVKFSD